MVQGFDVPDQQPYLKLTAPSGHIWEYGDVDMENAVIGSAVSFAQVVTQTRNVADTDLQMTGDIAQRWMETRSALQEEGTTPIKARDMCSGMIRTRYR